MKTRIISGVQQIGIGVDNIKEIWKWYKKYFGMNIRVFEDEAEASLMIDYTGNEVHRRTASYALNINGGGGFEIWQFLSRNTEKSSFDIKLGDLGIFACKIKSRDVNHTFNFFKENNLDILGELFRLPNKTLTFFVKDPNGNVFQIVESNSWFSLENNDSMTGGVCGAIIGVSDIEKSINFYSNLFDLHKVDFEENIEDYNYSVLNPEVKKFHKILLKSNFTKKSSFSDLFGEIQLELVNTNEYKQRKIFENRYWGDWGFIHLCFDVKYMDNMKKLAKSMGFPFVVDSTDTFDMGDAAGRFAYVEDPDGTLIEMVETHKLPISKKLGIFLNIKNRKDAPLPKILLKTLKLSKAKDI